MLPGATLIRECPHCHKPFRQETLASGNTFGAIFWTDGKMEAPMLPETPWLVKCPACDQTLWINDAKQIGEERFFEVDTRWPETRPFVVPTEEDYLFALKANAAADPGKTRYLRMRAWWAANDPFRRNPQAAGPVNLSPQTAANMQSLYESLRESDEEERLLKAELARELGFFEESVRLVALPCSGRYRHVVKVISDLAKQRRAEISIVRGDEAVTAEEIRAAEEARVARQAELEADLQAAKQLRAQRMKEGKVCPQCEFSYAWNGTTCGHCHYRKG